MHCLMNTL
ncbi:hypothetical protein YPPY01_4138, partial [Yersinia pestis PY-01]